MIARYYSSVYQFFISTKKTPYLMRTSLSPELDPGMESQVANSLAATTKQLFYYQSSADGDIKQIRESVEQLDNNIKASLIRFLITNSVHF
jgi:hypothetical protein